MCDFADDPGKNKRLMDTIDGMRVFLRALLAFGIKKADVKTMMVDNPAKLMRLD
jgi:predicted metal-dependent phosphotriesterase family hydrolase